MALMRAALWTGDETFEITEVPVPEVPDGWALVRVAQTGLCGTDFGIFQGTHPRARPPLIMGHEITGRVEAVRGGTLTTGELVAVEPLISCGTCWACRHGASHVCARLGLYGIDAPGGFAEFVAIPVDRLHAVPSEVDVQTATLIEPLAVAVHAVGKSGVQEGDTVAVFGSGPIGVLTALVARSRGAGRVIMTEPNPQRAEVAAGLGFTVTSSGDELLRTVAEATGGEGADVVFDSAGHPSVADFLVRVARPTATIVLVGVHKQPVPLDLRHVNFLEQRLQGVRVYTTADFAEAVRLAAAGVLPLSELPVETFDLVDVRAAFAAAMAPGRTLKVMVAS